MKKLVCTSFSQQGGGYGIFDKEKLGRFWKEFTNFEAINNAYGSFQDFTFKFFQNP
jgi:hypothetical protein